MRCCSNCGCNNGSCGCGGGCNYQVILPSEAPALLNFSNVNLAGIGVLDSASQPNINFRGVASANALMTATLDAGNHTVLLTVDSTAIAAALPTATEIQRGVGETASDAEAQAKAATDKFLVPSNLAALASSTIFAGLVELATNAETQAGASATLAVTPAGLASVTATQKTTTTWADAVARAALVPAFEGQFGFQLDSNNGYVATGAGAGAWSNLFTFGQTNVIPAASLTVISFGAGAVIDIIGAGGISVTGASSYISITGGNLDATSGTIQIDGAVDFQLTGSSIPANSLVASAGAGSLTSALISGFISANNVDTGWAVTNLTPLRTLDCAAATLGDLRNIVGTLLSIILDSTPLKPAA